MRDCMGLAERFLDSGTRRALPFAPQTRPERKRRASLGVNAHEESVASLRSPRLRSLHGTLQGKQGRLRDNAETEKRRRAAALQKQRRTGRRWDAGDGGTRETVGPPAV